MLGASLVCDFCLELWRGTDVGYRPKADVVARPSNDGVPDPFCALEREAFGSSPPLAVRPIGPEGYSDY